MSLWKHQQDAVQLATRPGVKTWALLFDVGTGKTRTLLEILRHHCNRDKKLYKTLIVSPKITLTNWRRQILLYTKVKDDNIKLLIGPNSKRAHLVRSLKNDPGIVVCSYEAIVSKEVFDAISGWKPEIIVLDESHKIKNPQATRTKAAVKISKLADYRYILTGSPVLNSLMDVWSQFLFLDQGEAFGDNFFVFRHRFFMDKNAGMPKARYFPAWVPKPGADEAIKKLIFTKASSAKKSEVLDLPPLVKERIEVELEGAQAKAYDQMETDFITFVNESPVVAELTLTKLMKLQQIASGFVKDENGKNHVFKENPKAEALGELLESILPNKIIIWAVFRQDYEVIREIVKKSKVSFVEVFGETKDQARTQAIESFNSDNTVKIFIANPGAVGIGIDLIAAAYMVYYSRGYKLEDDLQSEARNYRAGSEIHKSVTRIDIVAKNTVDELILSALENKTKMSDQVLRGYAKAKIVCKS